MPTDPCPCGSEPKPGLTEIDYVGDSQIVALVAAYGDKLISLLSPIYGRAYSLSTLCAQCPPPPPETTIGWYLSPIYNVDAILTAALAVTWNDYCQAKVCPPIVGCGGANHFDLAPSDGWLEDPVAGQYRYRTGAGTDMYVERVSTGTCFGPYNGIYVTWNTNAAFDPNQGVSIRNFNDTGAGGYNANPPGDDFNLRVYVGGGGGSGPMWPWNDGGITVADPPTPPVCDPADVCTALEYVYKALNDLRTATDGSWPLVANVGPTEPFVLPGLDEPVVGTLSKLIETVGTYLAPITPAQLANPTVTPVTASGPVDVTGTSYLSIAITTAPDYLGKRGTSAEIYYSNARGPGPGWALLYGTQGVIGYYPIVYPDGLQIVVPPMATSLLLDVMPGVELAVTTFTRSIT